MLIGSCSRVHVLYLNTLPAKTLRPMPGRKAAPPQPGEAVQPHAAAHAEPLQNSDRAALLEPNALSRLGPQFKYLAGGYEGDPARPGLPHITIK